MKTINQNHWKYIYGNGVSYHLNSSDETITLTVDGGCSFMFNQTNGQDKLLLTSNAMIYNGNTVRDRTNSTPITIGDTVFKPSFHNQSANYRLSGY